MNAIPGPASAPRFQRYEIDLSSSGLHLALLDPQIPTISELYLLTYSQAGELKRSTKSLFT